jgi:lipoprotein-releasing system permease protein/zinc transport system substrate-binding protein
MRLSFIIAKRYLFSKKSHNAINLIAMVSVCGIAVATMAMVCALSVFNGFQDLVQDMFGAFDPELKIVPAKGKVFDINHPDIRNIRAMPEIAIFSECLEDNVLVKYGDRQVPAVLKGVAGNFNQLTTIDRTIIDGTFRLSDETNHYVTFGVGLATNLGVSASFIYPVEIYVPKRQGKINPANPASSFVMEQAYIGSVFMINQPVYDNQYLIAPLSLARDLLQHETAVSAIELKLRNPADISKTQQKIQRTLGETFIVKNRYEQQEASFKMMSIEKWMTFLILCFIMTIAIFNVVGSLSMLIIEKRKDIATLRNLGADHRLIARIFLVEGWMISVIGGCTGIFLGILLCLVQQIFGLLKLGNQAGLFVVDAYPVRVATGDVFFILITVVGLGFLAAIYPVKGIHKG